VSKFLLDSNVVIGQCNQFLAAGQNIVKASVSDVEVTNLVRQGRISMPEAANQIPSVANSLNVDLRINVRGLLTPKLRAILRTELLVRHQLNEAPSLFLVLRRL